MNARYRGWSLFYGCCGLAIGLYVLRLTLPRHPRDTLGIAFGSLFVLVAARFLAAGLTGRVPSWLVTFIDAEK